MSDKLFVLIASLILVACTATASAGTLKDPLRPPLASPKSVAGERSAPSWKLASTLVAGDQRSAVINGRVLGLGDRVNGAEVVEIRPGAVRLRRSDKEFLVKLQRRGIRQETRP